MKPLPEMNLEKSFQTIKDYKYALDQADIVAITDDKGIIGYVNENFCRVSGYSADELVGQDHRIINSGYHDKNFFESLWQTIAAGKVWKGEIRNRAKDGSVYWVDTTIVPFMGVEGRPYQYLAIRHDITDRKRAEEKLAETFKELESFSYNVAHDLRSPLRIISGFGSLLKKDYSDRLDDDGVKLVDLVIQYSKHMTLLIENLLQFSRLGKVQLSLVHVNMQELVQAVVARIRHGHKEGKAVFKINSMLEAVCDPALINQVWHNLLENAIKYSAKSEHPLIEIGGEKRGKEIMFYISDNGAGFDIKQTGKLFQVFSRLHTRTELNAIAAPFGPKALWVKAQHFILPCLLNFGQGNSAWHKSLCSCQFPDYPASCHCSIRTFLSCSRNVLSKGDVASVITCAR